MVSYISERRGRHYFRMRVPQSLWEWVGCEIQRPLHQGRLQKQIPRCKLLAERIKLLFTHALQGKVDMKLLNPLVREVCANMLDDSILIESDIEHDLQDYDLASQFYRERFAAKDLTAASELIAYAKAKGIELDLNDPAAKRIIMDYYLGRIEVLRIQRERASGNVHNGYDEPDPSGNRTTLFTKADSSIPASQTQYLTHHIEKQDHEITTDQIVEVTGRYPIPQATVQQETPSEQSSPVPQKAEAEYRLSQGIADYLAERRTIGMDRKADNTLNSALSLLQEALETDPCVNNITRQHILPIWTDILPHLPSKMRKLVFIRYRLTINLCEIA